MTLPAFVQQGQGSTAVILLHGIGGSRTIWGDEASGTTAAIASAGYLAAAPDFPGYGESSGKPEMDAMVQAVLDLADHLANQWAAPTTVLLGHSMGGMVAQELVARHPQRIQGLVLACTSASFGKPDGAWQANFIAQRLAPLDAGLGMAGMAAQLVPAMVAPKASPAAVRLAQAVMAQVPEATYRVALQAIAAFDRRDALARISLPTLLLAAQHDRTAPPDVMQRMATRIRGSEYQCLEAAGHIANVEAPAAFNAAVLSYLSRHFASP